MLTSFELGRMHQRKYRFCVNCRRIGIYTRVECLQCRLPKRECNFLKSLCNPCRIKNNQVHSKNYVSKKQIIYKNLLRSCKNCGLEFKKIESGHTLYCSDKCENLMFKILRKKRLQKINEDKSYVK